MPVVTTQPSYLILNDVPLATPGWLANDLAAIFDDLPLVGEDREIPGDDGVIAYPRSIGAGTRSFPVLIFGEADDEGTPYDDPKSGIRANRDYLRANLGYKSQVGDGTVELIVHWADDYEEATRVINLGFSGFASLVDAQVGRLDLKFPSGDFVAVGS